MSPFSPILESVCLRMANEDASRMVNLAFAMKSSQISGHWLHWNIQSIWQESQQLTQAFPILGGPR